MRVEASELSYNLLFMEPCDAAKKSFKLVWRCHQLLSRFLAKGQLPRLSRQSRRSLMIRVIMKWSWGLCIDLLAFALQRRKPSAKRPSDEGTLRPVIVSNGAPFIQIRSVGSHSTSGREKERNKETTGVLWRNTDTNCGQKFSLKLSVFDYSLKL